MSKPRDAGELLADNIKLAHRCVQLSGALGLLVDGHRRKLSPVAFGGLITKAEEVLGREKVGEYAADNS